MVMFKSFIFALTKYFKGIHSIPKRSYTTLNKQLKWWHFQLENIWNEKDLTIVLTFLSLLKLLLVFQLQVFKHKYAISCSQVGSPYPLAVKHTYKQNIFYLDIFIK